jgi:hypothetical protein
MSIVCKCGQRFEDDANSTGGQKWQEHWNYYSLYRCSCGARFTTPNEWDAHIGIYDPVTYTWTGKTLEEAAAEGHVLENRDTHTADYNAHGGWSTSGF